jgi:hypothetical protein
MNAEAFLGHLAAIPSERGWGHHFQKTQGVWRLVFTNDGITTQDDPRLGPLPEGWMKEYWSEVTDRFYNDEFESDGTMRQLFFYNPVTDKAESSDPRLTSEFLKKKGVPFEDIIIV